MVRGEPRERAILTAALEELRERGYEAMTIDGVAARARASKATIYRRWSNKAELLKASLDSLDAEHAAAIPDTGALRSDLVEVLRALREKASEPYVQLMTELVSAARRDDALAALLREHVDHEELSPFHQVLGRAIKRREFSRRADKQLIHDVAEAMIVRRLQTGAPFDDAFIARVVDRVLLPLLPPNRRSP
jgi:AcrR family transcriptional regulator